MRLDFLMPAARWRITAQRVSYHTPIKLYYNIFFKKQLQKYPKQCGAEYRIRTDVNYSPPVWKTGALPTELTPLKIIEMASGHYRTFSCIPDQINSSILFSTRSQCLSNLCPPSSITFNCLLPILQPWVKDLSAIS